MADLKAGEFCAVLADPPWLERGAGQSKRGADRHYPLLSTHDIPRVMMAAPEWRIAPDAHLYLWATNNFLPDALGVVAYLGFRYVTNIAWVKTKGDGTPATGLGQYFRGSHELLLFAVRGSGTAVRTEARNIGSVVDEPACYGAPRGRHSAKPHLFHELVERRSRGPYLEMFGRGEPRSGWTSWGNQAGSDAPAPSAP
jgi:N6-adenosine-specific RNA methylase IME4